MLYDIIWFLMIYGHISYSHSWYRWVSARKMWQECISNGVTSGDARGQGTYLAPGYTPSTTFWLFVKCTLRNKIQGNFNQTIKIAFQGDTFEKTDCKPKSILFRQINTIGYVASNLLLKAAKSIVELIIQSGFWIFNSQTPWVCLITAHHTGRGN